MTEYIRAVSVNVTIDTNKQTYESTFTSLPKALAWLDEVVGQGLLDSLDHDRLLSDIEQRICQQRPAGASVEVDYIDNSLTGTVDAVLDAVRAQLVEKDA